MNDDGHHRATLRGAGPDSHGDAVTGAADRGGRHVQFVADGQVGQACGDVLTGRAGDGPAGVDPEPGPGAAIGVLVCPADEAVAFAADQQISVVDVALLVPGVQAVASSEVHGAIGVTDDQRLAVQRPGDAEGATADRQVRVELE